MVVFPDTMYTFRDTQEGGGGIKIDNFSSYLTFVTASSGDPNIACADPEGGGVVGGGARGPDPLEKHKLYENL